MTDSKILLMDEALWDHAEPFIVQHKVTEADTDALGHANNVCYLAWLERCAWEHSAAVGFNTQQMLKINRAMVVRNVQMQYLQATFAGDQLLVGDWISACDGRLRATRRFQVIRRGDQATVLRAEIEFVCINVESGRPTRMPAEFVAAYPIAPAIAAAADPAAT